MAVSDFTGLGDCIRLYTRSGAGFSSSGDGTDITGWTDDSSSSVNATNESNAPTHDATPPDSALAPAAEYADESDNGFDFGSPDLSGGAWTFGCCIRATGLTSFRNIFSSGGGAAEGSLYTSGGTLTYQEASTEATALTMSTGEIYTVCFYANATNYRVTVRDSSGTEVLDDSFTSIGTPTDQPSGLKVHSYGGSGAGWYGHGWAYVLFDADKFSSDADLHSYLREEAITASGQTIELGTIASGATTPSLTSVANGTPANVDLGTVASGATVHDLTSVAVGSDQNISLGTIASGATLPSLTSVATISGLHDAFEGTGSLDGYTTINASSLPDVTETGGHYSANLDDNTADVTTHFNGDYGRFDGKPTGFPFEIIGRNVGIETTQGSQTSPTITGNPYNFAGFQVQNDPADPTAAYRHFVAGIRGASGFGGSEYTVEAKTTTAGSSVQNDVGTNAITETRADLRIVGSAGKSISFYWQEPNQSGPNGQPDPNADSWTGPHAFPGTEPSWNDTVYVGLITYAYGTAGVPFYGTADAIEDILSAQNVTPDAIASGATVHDLQAVANAGTQNIDPGTIASGASLPNPAVTNGPANDITPNVIGSGATVHDLTSVALGSAQNVDLGTVASGATVHDLASVSSGPALSVDLGTVTSGATVHNISEVANALVIELGTIASGTTVHDLTAIAVASGSAISLGTITSGATVHNLSALTSSAASPSTSGRITSTQGEAARVGATTSTAGRVLASVA